MSTRQLLNLFTAFQLEQVVARGQPAIYILAADSGNAAADDFVHPRETTQQNKTDSRELSFADEIVEGSDGK